MIISLIVLLAFITVPCFAADRYYPTPSDSQIKSWWGPEDGQSAHEELEIKDVHRVRLKSGENAFVASVSFPRRARCCSHGILLVRPALQEARQTHSLRRVTEVIYLIDAQISAVAISGSFMGQGQLSGHNAILFFDEWQPIEIFGREFGNNLGDICGKTGSGRRCYSEEVKWLFTDIDGDGTKDLVELIFYKEGEDRDQLSWTTKVNAYLIKNKKLVPVPPRLIQSNLTESQAQEKSSADVSIDMQNHQNESSTPRKNEDSMDDDAIIRKFRSGLDRTVTNAREILSQFGFTAK
jgi:hypothetical protein